MLALYLLEFGPADMAIQGARALNWAERWHALVSSRIHFRVFHVAIGMAIAFAKLTLEYAYVANIKYNLASSIIPASRTAQTADNVQWQLADMNAM
jgi:hypothetical protein